MITVKNTNRNYTVCFSNGTIEAYSDTTPDKGGSGNGFRPHELLEASLACCLNIWLQKYANDNNIHIGNITAKVRVNRTDPEKTIMEYAVEFDEALNEELKQKLTQVAKTCPVHKTLSKTITFKEML